MLLERSRRFAVHGLLWPPNDVGYAMSHIAPKGQVLDVSWYKTSTEQWQRQPRTSTHSMKTTKTQHRGHQIENNKAQFANRISSRLRQKASATISYHSPNGLQSRFLHQPPVMRNPAATVVLIPFLVPLGVVAVFLRGPTLPELWGEAVGAALPNRPRFRGAGIVGVQRRPWVGLLIAGIGLCGQNGHFTRTISQIVDVLGLGTGSICIATISILAVQGGFAAAG